MATAVGMTILGAILNATAFTGGNILGQKLSGTGDALAAERVRHDKAMEKFTKDREKWSEKRLLLADWQRQEQISDAQAGAELRDTDFALSEVAEFEKPKFSSYYSPSPQQKKYEVIYIAGGLVLGLVTMKIL